MNYDLAMMALEGLARAPLTIRNDGSQLVIEGAPASFKDLARLFLLLGSADATRDDSFELQPGVHVIATAPKVVLRTL
jgi:hypothetical protein